MKKIFTSVFVLLICCAAIAQNAEITGTIKDADTKEGIVSASVRYGKGNGSITNADGKFRLSLPAGEHELVFSSIGYKKERQTMTLAAGEKKTLDIILTSSAFKLNEVVSVSQYKKNASTETVSISVISKDQIKNTNSNDLGEVVNKTPGVLVQDGQISIRGGSSFSYGVGSRTAVAVDGLDLSSGDLGQTQNTLVPLENVKQVEVIKGASSVMYGSSAMTGVINIITDWPASEEPKTEIETNTAVSDRPKDIRKKWWSAAPPFLGALNITHQRRIKDLQLITGGNIGYNSSYLQGDNYWRLRFFLKTRYIHPKVSGLTFGANTTVQIERADQFFIAKDLDSLALVPTAASNSNYQKFIFDPHLNYSNIKGHNYKLQIRYMNIFRKGNGDDDDAVSHSLILNNQYQYRFKEKLLILTAGIPFRLDQSGSNLYADKHLSFNFATFLQAEVNYKILSLQAGLRYEIVGQDSLRLFGYPRYKNGVQQNAKKGLPVFRAGLNIQASKSTNIRASFGQGFRIPQIGERLVAAQFSPGVNIVPNDTLKTESSWGMEIGIQQGVKIKEWKAGIDVALFWQEYQNYIEYTVGFWDNKYSNGTVIFPDKGPTVFGMRALNIEAARVAGYEISLLSSGKLGPVGINITAGYTYTYPARKDNDTGAAHYTTKEYLHDFFAYNGKRITENDTVPSSKLLSYRMRHMFRGDIELKYWKAYLGATFYYVSTPEAINNFYRAAALVLYGDEKAIDKELAKHGNGDFAMDMRAGIKVNDHFSMGFIVKNLTNHFYSLRPGRPEALRTYTFQFRYNF